jgi:hypothetical protein
MKEYRVVVDEFGNIFWHKPGTNEYHREGGPAIEWADGADLWYVDNVLHRENGPAIEYNNGEKYWFLNGESLTEEEYSQRMGLTVCECGANKC